MGPARSVAYSSRSPIRTKSTSRASSPSGRATHRLLVVHTRALTRTRLSTSRALPPHNAATAAARRFTIEEAKKLCRAVQ
jgi:hypothetical protein